MTNDQVESLCRFTVVIGAAGESLRAQANGHSARYVITRLAVRKAITLTGKTKI